MVTEGRSGSSAQRRTGPVIVGKVIAHFLHQVLEVGLTGDHLIDEVGQRPPLHRLHHQKGPLPHLYFESVESNITRRN